MMGSLKLALSSVAIALVASGPVIAQDALTVTSYGGSYTKSQEQAFYEPFEACVASNRILVQDGIHDLFAKRLTEAASTLKVGNGLEADSTLGPMVNTAAINKISTHVEDAVIKGAEVVAGGRVLSGLFYAPTILTNVTVDMLVFTEETFGPVAPLFRFSTEEEAIAMANNTPYGLSAYFYTQNVNRVFRVGEALDFGMIGINVGSVTFAAAGCSRGSNWCKTARINPPSIPRRRSARGSRQRASSGA